MATFKTQPNDADVELFIDAIEDERRRDDCRQLAAIMSDVIKAKPKMWGDSIVGFGQYQYRYPSGREGEWFVAGFSPRIQALSIYAMGNAAAPELLEKLGDCKRGKSCIYVKRLDDIHLPTLKRILKVAVKRCRAMSAEAATHAKRQAAQQAPSRQTPRRKK